MQGEFLTFHNHIIFDVKSEVRQKGNNIRSKWIFDKIAFLSSLNRQMQNRSEMTDETLTELLSQAIKENSHCYKSKRTMPFWWSAEIAEQRKICVQKRRKITRLNRNTANFNEAVRQQMQNEYKRACQDLKRLISKSKRECWKALIKDLETDIWGEGFKIVTKRLGNRQRPYVPAFEERKNIICELFPRTTDYWLRTTLIQSSPPLFTKEELLAMNQQIRVGKAPGADRITPEVVKLTVLAHVDVVLSVMNGLLLTQRFPTQWKTATIALIEKKTAPGSPLSYRPICMLSSLGKLFERLIKHRLEEELKEKGGLSEMQFGFRKGRSAV